MNVINYKQLEAEEEKIQYKSSCKGSTLLLLITFFKFALLCLV
jgi:hypothetical protein